MAALRKQHVFVNFVPIVFFNAVAGKVGLMGKQLFLFPFLFILCVAEKRKTPFSALAAQFNEEFTVACVQSE